MENEFIKIAFSSELLIEQILYVGAFIFICVLVGLYMAEKKHAEEERDNLIDSLIIQKHVLEEEVEQSKEDIEKKNRRLKEIEAALSSRTAEPDNKQCNKCGGVFGQKATCQYCGNPK